MEKDSSEMTSLFLYPALFHHHYSYVMGQFWIILGIVALVGAISIPAIRYEKRTGKKLGRGSALAGLQVINELFQPSAANSALIIEEQREARVANPSPEDKLFEGILDDYLTQRNKSDSV